MIKFKNILEWILYQLKMLKHRPRLIWNSLYIRKNEFHKSLEIDMKSVIDMSEKDRKQYFENLTKRREIAHYRDFK